METLFSSRTRKTGNYRKSKQVEVTVVPKELDEINITAPVQVKLFGILDEDQTLESVNKKLQKVGGYSQSLSLIDQMPRFFLGHQEKIRKKYNGLLPALVRDFDCDGTPYRIEVTPALLVDEETDESVAHYPGKGENVLDIILRNFYLSGNPQLFDGKCGMRFSINSIMEEMTKHGHARSYYEIIDSLKILKGSQITCRNKINNEETIFSVIDSLKLKKNKSDTSHCYLTFSDVMTVALNHLQYRRYNYNQVVSYKSYIARRLHMRISHRFTQVSEDNYYPINVSTMIVDFGLSYKNLTETISQVKKALEQMKEAYVVKSYEEAPIYDPVNKRKMVDFSLKIKFTQNFIFEMIRSNKIKRNVKSLKKATGVDDLPTESNVDASLFPLYALKESEPGSVN